ncbi:MAG TPA: tetratricopeptide repeat protein, partial [Thermoanaerobaculia bacterium]|nr:tetratricopeptide repeat protein [Thermoanaerobaculia bacterium]
FDDALRDPLSWKLADSMAVRREAPPELLAQARAIAAEDRYAREVLLPIVESPIRFSEARVGDDPRFRTLAVIRLLCSIANKTHEQQPQYGLVLADAALSICAQLPEPAKSKSGWFVGTAWKERANALRYLGRFRDAEAALDDAEEAFGSDERPEPFDLAIVAFVRATVCWELERFEDAVTAARFAAETFSVYGDTTRYLSALIVEGAAYYSATRESDAAAIFERVVTLARSGGEAGILARALGNAGNCYARLQDYDKASSYYTEALAVLDELDFPTESVRLSWRMAALQVARGAFDEGLAGLDQGRLRLIQLGMANDAALATLDLVAALLALDRPDRVPALCREIAVTFSSEGMMRSAKKALAYLSEAVASGQATPEKVRHVRGFLERLTTHPQEEFQQIQ